MAWQTKKQEPQRVFTLTAKLNPAHNQEIIEAFEAECHAFNQAKIRTFHHIRHLAMQGISFGSHEKKEWNRTLQKDFRIVKRTANSIITEAQTVWDMQAEAAKTRLQADIFRQKSIEKEISELEKKKEKAVLFLSGKKPLKKKKTETEQQYQARSAAWHEKEALEQRKRRSRLVSLKKRLDRLKARIEKQSRIIETGNYRICFGTKKLRASGKRDFCAWRERQMSFTGSSDETAQNQIFQIFYTRSRNQFEIRMRKDFYDLPEKQRQAKEQDYAHGRVHFDSRQKRIVQILSDHSAPLSYRIIRTGKTYWLSCSFAWKESAELQSQPVLNPKKAADSAVLAALEAVKDREPKAVGVDINKGFLSVSIAGSQGGLLYTFDMDYRFRAGNRTESDMALLCSRIAWLAQQLNVPVVIEEISLFKKKAQAQKRKNRAMNRMLHSFAYRLYKQQMDSACFRRGVSVIRVNPAWTSETARRKYCIAMKLCVHNGAAWVIARRGLGIYEKLPAPVTKEEKALLFVRRKPGKNELKINDDTLPF